MAASEIKAGVAREMFVLPRWVPLAGYSRRHGKPSHGVHDPTGVRALVVRDDHTVVALVSCDLLIIDEQLFEEVHRRLLQEGMPAQLVLLLAGTHTHSGPGGYGHRWFEKLSMGHFDPVVFDALAHAITEAIVHASAMCEPVLVTYQTALTDGLVVNRMEAGGIVDNELIVSGFYRPGAKDPFAVIVNFAAHPTTLGASNWELSADYPGVVMREVERHLPGATCLFFAGAVGDQAPVKSGEGFGRADTVGLPLAQRTVELLAQATPEAPAALHALAEHLPLPPARVRLGRFMSLPHWVSQRLVDDDATLTIVAIGQTMFIGVPCDLSAVLGQALKATTRAHDDHPIVVGFASDYIGYCMPAALYETPAYEALMAFNGPRTGELIVERLKQMIHVLVTSGE